MQAGESQALFTAMGCPCEIRLFATDNDLSQQVLHQCHEEALRFQNKFSRYRDDSIVSRINHSAGQSPVTIDPETSAIMQYSSVCYVQSNGLFDITSGVLRKIWNMDTQTLPKQSEIDNCLQTIGWDKVTLETDSIFLPDPGMELDLGGVVKEYASDAIAEKARQSGIESGYINLGGDIAIIGPQPDKRPWPIGISDPDRTDKPVATIQLSKGGVSTSGGYERYTNIDGKHYSHMINPKTGWPVDSLISVSVAAHKAVVAGSMTSIALLQGSDSGVEFLKDSGVAFFAIDQSGEYHGHLEKITND